MPQFLSRVVAWLRDGYPAGIPVNDVAPVLALLRRRLTDDEVHQVADALREQGLVRPTIQDIGEEIRTHLHGEPAEEDLRRVALVMVFRDFPQHLDDDDTAPQG